MINPTQAATFLIGAMLSASVFSGGLDQAVASPIEVSSGEAAAIPKIGPIAHATGDRGNTPVISVQTAAPAALPPAGQQQAAQPRVYLFRGALGPIFSRGMDRLTKRIKQAGITANVYEFTICRLIAESAIQVYREDPAPIVLIGHSMGGYCALKFAEMFQAQNFPVSLIVTIDPAHVSPDVPLNVVRYINIFLSKDVLGGGDVGPKQGYQGHYASFDLSKHDDISHINIEKMDSIHEQLVGKILQLTTTPAKVEGETVPIRCVVPADSPIELWDIGMPVFARAGDTLQTLAASYQVPLWSLTQINPGSDSAPLMPGQRVVVPRHLVPLAPVASQSVLKP